MMMVLTTREKAEADEMNRFMLLATKYLNENPDDNDPTGKELLSDLVEEQPEEEDTPKDKPMGLMSKRLKEWHLIGRCLPPVS